MMQVYSPASMTKPHDAYMHQQIRLLLVKIMTSSLSHVWWQAIIWTNAGTLLIGPLWTNFSEIWIKIPIFIQENEFENVNKMAAILF